MNLVQARKRALLTQQELAERIAVDRSTVSKWESGGSMPTADKLIRIAEILSCTTDELLK